MVYITGKLWDWQHEISFAKRWECMVYSTTSVCITLRPKWAKMCLTQCLFAYLYFFTAKKRSMHKHINYQLYFQASAGNQKLLKINKHTNNGEWKKNGNDAKEKMSRRTKKKLWQTHCRLYFFYTLPQIQVNFRQIRYLYMWQLNSINNLFARKYAVPLCAMQLGVPVQPCTEHFL